MLGNHCWITWDLKLFFLVLQTPAPMLCVYILNIWCHYCLSDLDRLCLFDLDRLEVSVIYGRVQPLCFMGNWGQLQQDISPNLILISNVSLPITQLPNHIAQRKALTQPCFVKHFTVIWYLERMYGIWVSKMSFIGIPNIRADSRFVPSQWEALLQSNGVPHWLGANLDSALQYCNSH